MIKRIQLYEADGKHFPTIAKAVDHLEGKVEAFCRTIPGFQDVPLKRRIAFVQFVLDNRVKLRELLNFTDEAVCDDYDD